MLSNDACLDIHPRGSSSGRTRRKRKGSGGVWKHWIIQSIIAWYHAVGIYHQKGLAVSRHQASYYPRLYYAVPPFGWGSLAGFQLSVLVNACA